MSEADKLVESEKLKKRAGELFKVENIEIHSEILFVLSLLGWALLCGL